jgi:hypothetical protein
MSGFVVDSRTLLAVRDTLGRLNEQLVGMHTVIWHEWGALGGVALESELEHFCTTWHSGVTELGGQLQDLTWRLGEAAQAYERIEQRITQAGAGSTPTSATGAGHAGTALTGGATRHATAKHHTATEHHAPAKHHAGPTGPGGKHYSGGVGIAPAGAGSGHSGEQHKHSGDKHSTNREHSGVGSGTTVIPPGPTGGSRHAGGGHHAGSGSGVTVIGGTGPASRSGGSGTTTIDEKIHHAEDRQRSELAAILKFGPRLNARIQRA